MDKSKKQRVVYFDILNIIAIVSVIALHCNGIVHSNPNIRAWDTSLIVECVCFFAVPLFIMLSGANLMTYREKYDTKTFFKKRFLKVLIPFLFWSIVMFIWRIFVLKTIKIGPGEGINLINYFFSNKQESTYYFVWCILGIYLTMPLLSLLANKKYKKTLWFTVIIYFIVNAFIPNILKLFNINVNMNATVLLGGYVIYAILGYLLSNYTFKKKYRYFVYIGALVGLIFRYIITYILSKQTGNVVNILFEYTQWHCILLSTAIFLIIKNIGFDKLLLNNDRTKKILSEISGCSYGIYLIHKIIMFYEIKILNISVTSWVWRTAGIVITYMISLLIIYLLRKIPGVKKIVS